MKKSIIIGVCVLAVSAVVFSQAFARPDVAPRSEGEMQRQGAVKQTLYERLEGDDPQGPGSGADSGWAIANIDPCEALLKINTKLDAGMAEAEYDVYVKVSGAVNLVGTLMTNIRGIGTAQFYLDASLYVGPESPEYVDVQVVVKPTGTTDIIGFATDTFPVAAPECCEDCDDEDDDEEPMG